MADSAQDRQLPASERKKLKARTEGQVPRSRDLVHFVVIAAAVGGALAVGHRMLEPLLQLLDQGLRFDASAMVHASTMTDRLAAQGLWGALVVVVGCGTLAMASVVGGVLGGGWNLSFTPLVPKWEKLDPIAGLGRLVDPQQVGGALKASLLALVIGGVGGVFIWQHLRDFAALATLPLSAALTMVSKLVGA